MTDFLEIARKRLAMDGDHMTRAEGEQLHWLIAQLTAWPTRVDEACTTNQRFLMQSAASTLMRHDARVTELLEANNHQVTLRRDLATGLRRVRDFLQTAPLESGVCCGDRVDSHTMGSGHSPVDDVQYAVRSEIEAIDRLLETIHAPRPTD